MVIFVGMRCLASRSRASQSSCWPAAAATARRRRSSRPSCSLRPHRRRPRREPAPGATVEAEPATPGESTQEPPPGEALPGGVATVQGRYRVTYKDYSPSGYNLNDTYTGKVTRWNAETTCDNGTCTVQLRRAL